jgi:hypothetical protein
LNVLIQIYNNIITNNNAKINGLNNYLTVCIPFYINGNGSSYFVTLTNAVAPLNISAEIKKDLVINQIFIQCNYVFLSTYAKLYQQALDAKATVSDGCHNQQVCQYDCSVYKNDLDCSGTPTSDSIGFMDLTERIKQNKDEDDAYNYVCRTNIFNAAHSRSGEELNKQYQSNVAKLTKLTYEQLLQEVPNANAFPGFLDYQYLAWLKTKGASNAIYDTVRGIVNYKDSLTGFAKLCQRNPDYLKFENLALAYNAYYIKAEATAFNPSMSVFTETDPAALAFWRQRSWRMQWIMREIPMQQYVDMTNNWDMIGRLILIDFVNELQYGSPNDQRPYCSCINYATYSNFFAQNPAQKAIFRVNGTDSFIPVYNSVLFQKCLGVCKPTAALQVRLDAAKKATEAAQAKAEADAKAKKAAEEKAAADAAAKVKAEQEAKAKAEAAAKKAAEEKAAAEAAAKKAAEEKAAAEAAAKKAQEAAAAQAKAEAEKKAAEAKLKAEEEAKIKAAAAAKAAEDAAAKAKAAEEKAKADAAAKKAAQEKAAADAAAKKAAEEKKLSEQKLVAAAAAKAAADTKAKAEAAAKAKAEQEAKAAAEKAKQSAEAAAKAKAEQEAKKLAESKAKAEAAAKAKAAAEAEKKAKDLKKPQVGIVTKVANGKVEQKVVNKADQKEAQNKENKKELAQNGKINTNVKHESKVDGKFVISKKLENKMKKQIKVVTPKPILQGKKGSGTNPKREAPSKPFTPHRPTEKERILRKKYKNFRSQHKKNRKGRRAFIRSIQTDFEAPDNFDKQNIIHV